MALWIRALNGDGRAADELLGQLHPDASAFLPKMTRLGGDYPTRQATEALFRDIIDSFSSRDAALQVTTDAVFETGDSVAFLQHNEGATLPDGTRYRPTLVIILTMRDGLLWRYQEFFGTPWLPTMPRQPWQNL